MSRRMTPETYHLPSACLAIEATEVGRALVHVFIRQHMLDDVACRWPRSAWIWLKACGGDRCRPDSTPRTATSATAPFGIESSRILRMIVNMPIRYQKRLIELAGAATIGARRWRLDCHSG